MFGSAVFGDVLLTNNTVEQGGHLQKMAARGDYARPMIIGRHAWNYLSTLSATTKVTTRGLAVRAAAVATAKRASWRVRLTDGRTVAK